MTDVGFATLGVIPSVRGLRAELDKQTSTFDSSGRKAGERYGDAVGKGAGSRLKTSMKSALLPVSGILAGLGGARIFGDMIAEAQEAAKVGKITAQLIKTTGGAANLSATQVGNLSTSLSKYAAVDDELIQGGENLLLTFKNVRDEVGKGNNVFSRATKASLDLSTVLGGDMKSSALQLGKALNDPVKGITALARAGVQFSADQKTQIKNFVASNDLLSAQKLILGEVERQVGGAAGANATDLDRLSVSFKNLEEAAGTAAAPALNKVAQVATNDVIPAIESMGGFVGDAARIFGALPAPIKVATGALVAFRAAQAFGVGNALSTGSALVTKGLDDIRLRASLVSDEYKRLRQGQLDIIQGSGKFTPAAGRMASALGAIEVGAIGAGRGLKAGLSGALGLVGGPWGAAFIAGTVVLTHFWQEHLKAQQRVKDFTATLDAETGAMTESSRAFAAKALLESGALESSQRLGLSLKTVTDAALGNKTALASITAQMAAKGPLDDKAASDAITLNNAIGAQSGIVKDATANQKLLGAATGTTASAQEKSTTATGAYVDKVKAARDAIKGLLDVENKRRNANLGILGDQIALNQAVADAQAEAKKGKATLDLNTQAGRDNASSLRDLADAWNGSSGKVKNAKGAYAEMRQTFIDTAIKMGDTKKQAQKLADQILDIPKRSATEITTPGIKPALKALREARKELEAIHNFALTKIVITAQANKNRGNRNTFATGGMIGGRGSGTSDSNLIFASRGEFMQRKAAVDYYGADFMAALNNLQVPRFASGGLIGGGHTTTAPSVAGQEIVGVLRLAEDGTALIDGVVRRGIDTSEASYQRRRREAALGGMPA